MNGEFDDTVHSVSRVGGRWLVCASGYAVRLGCLMFASRKGRALTMASAILSTILLLLGSFLHFGNSESVNDGSLQQSSSVARKAIDDQSSSTDSSGGILPRLTLPIADANAENSLIASEEADRIQSKPDAQGLGGPINDYEQALQVDSVPDTKERPKVSVLAPIMGEETLVPTRDVNRIVLQSTDVRSLADSPIVLTKSSVGVGDSLSLIFKRNNLITKYAFELLNTPGAEAVSVLYPGDLFKFIWSDDRLLGIELRRRGRIGLMATFDGAHFSIVSQNVMQRAGSLVKLLEREIEAADQSYLVKFEKKYAAIKNSSLTWHNNTVEPGGSLSEIFQGIGLTAKNAVKIATYPGNEWLATGLKPGQQINIAISEDGEFAILESPENATAKVRLVFPTDDGYFVGFKKLKTERQVHQACAEVEHSLFAAGLAVNIPKDVLNKFVGLFDSRIDFSRQLRPGDRFCVIYERSYVKGKPLDDIGIKAASLIQSSHELRAFEHVDDDGQIAYYDSEGISMKGHFLRSPIKYARVSSTYSMRRFHPILKIHRPHLGVDYGAKTGTPIHATATGKVIKRAYYRGYGKMIVLQHGSQYRTLYAHMSRFAEGTRKGSFIKQGQVIGYVGSTGMSTGPHLHYEFHVNGKHRDPLTYDMPKGEPISDEYRDTFMGVVDEFSQRLASIGVPQVEYRPPPVRTASSQ